MYYDTLTLSAVTDELRERLLQGRVQKVVAPTPLSVGLEVYAGHRYPLWLNADPQLAGVYLMETKLRRGTERPSPLHLLLVKYLEGARLEALEQPSLERVLRLTFRGEQGAVDLLCEIMGRHSNIILIGPDGVIMDSIKRIPPSINRYRTILPQHVYVAPPPQDKEQPLLLTTARLGELLRPAENKPLWRILVERIAGISPILAREIVFRATGQSDPALPLDQEHVAALLQCVLELLSLPHTHAWSPCLAFETRAALRIPLAYAPYELTHLPDRERAPSMHVAIERVLEARQAIDPYQQVRERLRGLVEAQSDRQHARLEALRRALVPEEQIEAARLRGSAILALAWKIQPRQTELWVDPAETGQGDESAERWRIALDPLLSPAENAEKHFREYRKLKAAASEVPALISQVEAELGYLQQLATEVALAENRPQLDEVEQELQQAGYTPQGRSRNRPSKSRPLALHARDGALILVGRNSRQNDEITFGQAAPQDLWLHAHRVPGSHVIIKSGGATLSDDTLLLAARLAAYYSAARDEPRVQVDYALRQHVRRIKGGRPGMVTYTHEQTVVVDPMAAKDALKE
jgi:predicted ribosome quality control (RQC) complex YloA/Tae2 family protein